MTENEIKEIDNYNYKINNLLVNQLKFLKKDKINQSEINLLRFKSLQKSIKIFNKNKSNK